MLIVSRIRGNLTWGQGWVRKVCCINNNCNYIIYSLVSRRFLDFSKERGALVDGALRYSRHHGQAVVGFLPFGRRRRRFNRRGRLLLRSRSFLSQVFVSSGVCCRHPEVTVPVLRHMIRRAAHRRRHSDNYYIDYSVGSGTYSVRRAILLFSRTYRVAIDHGSHGREERCVCRKTIRQRMSFTVKRTADQVVQPYIQLRRGVVYVTVARRRRSHSRRTYMQYVCVRAPTPKPPAAVAVETREQEKRFDETIADFTSTAGASLANGVCRKPISRDLSV